MPRARPILGCLVFAALLSAAPAAAAEATRGLPLVPGSRPAETPGVYVSGRGLRDTRTFYSRHLRRAGIAHRVIPLQRRRGVEHQRFLATGDDSPWAAIQVYRHRGVTYVAIVGPPPLDLDP